MREACDDRTRDQCCNASPDIHLVFFNVFDMMDITGVVDPAWYDAETDNGDIGADPMGPRANNHAYAPARHLMFGLELGW